MKKALLHGFIGAILMLILVSGSISINKPITQPQEVTAQSDARKSNQITTYRQAFTNLVSSLEAWERLSKRDAAMGFSAGLVDGDFVGDNAGITAEYLTDGVTAGDSLVAHFRQSGQTRDLKLYRVAYAQ